MANYRKKMRRGRGQYNNMVIKIDLLVRIVSTHCIQLKDQVLLREE